MLVYTWGRTAVTIPGILPPSNCSQGRKWKAENMFSPHISATFSGKKTLLRSPSAVCPSGHTRQAELQWRLSKVTFHLSVSIPLLRNRQGKGEGVKMIQEEPSNSTFLRWQLSYLAMRRLRLREFFKLIFSIFWASSGSCSHKLVGDKAEAKSWVSLTHNSTHVLDRTTEERMVRTGKRGKHVFCIS